eukprot:scaffold10.g2384.t1
MGAHERYEWSEVIGKGSFGEVYKGVDTVEGREVAIKVIDLEDIEEDIGEIQREIAMLRTCRSPNITEYYGSAVLPGSSKLLIAMELMAVSAADLVGGDDGVAPLAPLPEPAIAYVLREVLSALAYLHSEHRIHRDIKAANILLSAAGDVKARPGGRGAGRGMGPGRGRGAGPVSDFGVSAQLTGTVSKRRTFVGSPLWMAPEVIEQSPETAPPPANGGGGRAPDGYDEAADIWSLGITAIELATGEPPRASVSSFRLLFMIVRDDPPQLEGPFSTDLRDFVWRCLQKDPRQRPSAADLLHHPFVAEASRPPELQQRVIKCLAHRPRLAAGKDALLDQPDSATLPRWDFVGAGGGDAPAATGTVSAAKPPRPGSLGSLAAVAAPVPEQQRPATAPGGGGGGEGLGGTIRAVPAAEAAPDRRHTDSDAWCGTVVAKPPLPPASLADSAATVVPAPPGRRIHIPNDPRIPDAPTPGGGPPASDSAPPTASSRAAAGAGAAPDSGPIRLLVQPALVSAAGGSARAAAAAEAALAALGALEAAQPGATRSALTDMLALLSVSSSPSLAPLKSSAVAVFACGGGSPDGSAAGAAPGSLAAQQQQFAAAQDLGPLGNFLLARWRESAARERAASGGRHWAQARGAAKPPSRLDTLHAALGLQEGMAPGIEMGIHLLQQLAAHNASSGAAAAAAPQVKLEPYWSHLRGAGSVDGEHSGAEEAGHEAQTEQQAAGAGRAVAGAGGQPARPAPRAGRAARTPDQRLHATKEKNRKAQQRFRQRQKEKMVWLQQEVKRLAEENARLSALLQQHAAEAVAAAAPAAAAAPWRAAVAAAALAVAGAAAPAPPSLPSAALGATLSAGFGACADEAVAAAVAAASAAPPPGLPTPPAEPAGLAGAGAAAGAGGGGGRALGGGRLAPGATRAGAPKT